MVPAGPERQKRFKVLDWGENPNYNGARVNVGRRLAEEAAKPTYAFRLVALDYEHNTEPTAAEFKVTREPRDIAGYGLVEVVPGDGVWMTMILWAAEPDGWERAHTFADVSANPVVDAATGEVVALKSVALVRTGATDKHFLDVPLAAAVQGNTKEGGKRMDKLRGMVIAALGLAEAATDEEIGAALKAALTKEEPQAAVKPAETAVPMAAQIAAAVNAAVTPLAARFAELTAANHRRDVDGLLERSRAEGKAVPLSAETAYGLPLASVADIIGKTPVTVPLAARTPERVAEAALRSGPSEAERAVALNCGMDPEAVFGKPKA